MVLGYASPWRACWKIIRRSAQKMSGVSRPHDHHSEIGSSRASCQPSPAERLGRANTQPRVSSRQLRAQPALNEFHLGARCTPSESARRKISPQPKKSSASATATSLSPSAARQCGNEAFSATIAHRAESFLPMPDRTDSCLRRLACRSRIPILRVSGRSPRSWVELHGIRS